MPSFSFAYSDIPLPATDPFPNGNVACRPLVRTRLVAPTNAQRFSCVAVVDSGADHCVFPLAFASALGLDPLAMKMQMTGGVGNQANATYFAPLKIELPLGSGTSLTFEALAGFTAGLDAIGMGLLGQTGFFEAFTVTFSHRSKLFILEG